MTAGSNNQRQRNNAGGSRNTGNRNHSRSTGSRSGNTRRSQAGSRSRSTKQGSSDGLTNVLLVLLLATIVVLMVIYLKNESEEDKNASTAPTAQAGPTEAAQKDSETAGEPEQGNTETQGTQESQPDDEKMDLTPLPTLTPQASVTPAQADSEEKLTPTPTSQPDKAEGSAQSTENTAAVSEEDAYQRVSEAFWGAGENYRASLADKKLEKNGKSYYCYTIYYKGEKESYSLLVDRQSGELIEMDQQGVCKPFEGIAKKEENSGQLDKDTILKQLEGISAGELMLPAELKECELVADEWKTTVNGVECYCVNVFYEGRLAGVIYYSENAANVYVLDEFGEFQRVR